MGSIFIETVRSNTRQPENLIEKMHNSTNGFDLIELGGDNKGCRIQMGDNRGRGSAFQSISS